MGRDPHSVGGKNKTPRLAFNAGFGFAITAGSKNKDIGWELIKFATSQAYHEELLTVDRSGIDPDRYSGLTSPKYKAFQPLVQPLLDAVALENSLAWPTAAYAPKLENALTDELAWRMPARSRPSRPFATPTRPCSEIIDAQFLSIVAMASPDIRGGPCHGE